MERNRYVLGNFVWTGMDYLGEAGVGAARLDNERGVYFDAFCGDLDLCGFKKPVSYYRGVVWGVSPLEVFVIARFQRAAASRSPAGVGRMSWRAGPGPARKTSRCKLPSIRSAIQCGWSLTARKSPRSQSMAG